MARHSGSVRVPAGLAALPPAAQQRLGDVLRRDGDRGFARLSQALSHGDHAAVASEAHRLRGAFRMMGAHRLDAILERIESRARTSQNPRPVELSWAHGIYDTWIRELDRELEAQAVTPV